MYKKKLLIGWLFFVAFSVGAQTDDNEVVAFQKRKNSELAYNKAITNYISGDLQAALTLFTEAISINPNFDKAYLQRGKIKYGLKDTKAAVDDISMALKINSLNGEASFCLGYYGLLTDTATALMEHFDNAIKNGFTEPYVYYYRSLLKAYKKDVEGAISDVSVAIEKKPDYILAFFDRGKLKNLKGDYQGAIYDFRQALSLDSTISEAYNNIAFAKVNTGDYQGAITDINKVVAVQTQNYVAFNLRGSAKYMLTDYAAAIEDFKLAISLKADYAPAFVGYGNALSKLNDNKTALEQFNKALELNPQMSDALVNRGLVKELLGDIDGACSDWRAAANLGNINAVGFVKECK